MMKIEPILSPAFLVGLFCFGDVYAAEYDLEAEAGLVNTDNAFLENNNAVDELTLIAGVTAAIQHESKMFSLSARGHVDRRTYTNDNFVDETLGQVDINARVSLIGDVLTWSARNNFGQLLADPLQPVRPDNRDDVNTFSTGPDLRFRFGQRNRFDVLARFTSDQFEDSAFNNDNEQIRGRIGLVRELTPVRELGLFVEQTEITFDDDFFNADYESRSAYLGLTSEAARSTLRARLGYNEIETDAGDSSSGPLAELEFSRELSPTSSLGVFASQSFVDAGQLFARTQGRRPVLVAGEDINNIAQAFESSNVGVQFQKAWPRSEVRVTLDWRDEEFPSAPVFNRERTAVNISWDYQIGAYSSVSVFAERFVDEFARDSSEDDDAGFGLTFRQQLGRRLSLDLRIESNTRESTRANGDFDEFRAALFFRYKLLDAVEN